MEDYKLSDYLPAISWNIFLSKSLNKVFQIIRDFVCKQGGKFIGEHYHATTSSIVSDVIDWLLTSYDRDAHVLRMIWKVPEVLITTTNTKQVVKGILAWVKTEPEWSQSVYDNVTNVYIFCKSGPMLGLVFLVIRVEISFFDAGRGGYVIELAFL